MSISAEELAEILQETGRNHHHAYISSDGSDPEWAKWYASYLQARVWDGFGELPTQSELIHLLVGADRAHRSDRAGEPWPEYYARFILEHMQ